MHFWFDQKPHAKRMLAASMTTLGIGLAALALFGGPVMAGQPVVSDPLHLRSGWKYYYDSALPNPDASLHNFFLQDSIKATRLPSGKIKTVTVWTKGLSAEAIDKVSRLSPEAVDRAAKKLVVGYDPPFSTIRKLSRDERLDLIAWEEIADDQTVQSEIKMLLEIDCEQDMTRALSIVLTHGGKMRTSDTPGQWMHLVPETSGSNLSKIICR